MNRNLKIVFMGTPDFAVASLKALVDQEYQIVGVITAPDKPAGRGQKLRESAVKIYAKSKGLPLLQPSNLKDRHFLETLSSLKANLQIVVAFRMLPKLVWQMPEYGTFNLHASLLPNYRGAAPINWAIIKGETKTGVSTFYIDEKIDTGEIILQEDILISPTENAGILHDKLMVLGSQVLLKTVALIAQGSVTLTPQDQKSVLHTAYKLNKDNCKIDWSACIDTIHNKIRGLSPYPSAWCRLINGDSTVDVKIYEADKILERHALAIGTIIATKNEIKVAVAGGFMNLQNIKLPGKRTMAVASLLNGYKFKENAIMQ